MGVSANLMVSILVPVVINITLKKLINSRVFSDGRGLFYSPLIFVENPPQLKITFARFLPAIGMFLLVCYLLTIPGKKLPEINWFDQVHGDKFVHIGLFGALVFWWCWPFRKSNVLISKRLQWFLLVAIMAAVYGVLMEFVQKYWIPNRSFDVDDMIADAAGALGGYWWARKFFTK